MPTITGINWAAVAGLLALGTIIGGIVGWIFKRGKRDERIDSLIGAVAEMRSDDIELHKVVARLVARDEARSPYFDELQRSLATSIHKPSPLHAKMDRLLEELQALTLTPERRDELKALIRVEIDNPEIAIALSLSVVSDEEKLRIQNDVNELGLLLATMPIVLAKQVAKDKIAMQTVKDALSEEPSR